MTEEETCVRCCARPRAEGRRWCSTCIVEDTKCHFCVVGTADRGTNVCETCDRRMRDKTRASSNLPPFTDAEYRALRRELGRRVRGGVLVLDGRKL